MFARLREFAQNSLTRGLATQQKPLIANAVTHAVLAFDDFRLDPGQRRLTRGGRVLDVSARYLDALILLTAEAGRLVTKDRFLDEVWRGVPVTDEALTQCIRALRRALGDDAANPRYIETVPRYGYRFIGAVKGNAGDPPAAHPADPPPPGVAWSAIAQDTLAGALGGAAAGVVAALAYVMAGLVAPGIGAASTLLVLISVNLLLGLAGGAFVGAGFGAARALGGPTPAWSMLGAAIGGALVGAVAQLIGTDLLTLFFGQAPARMTGAAEGLVLGAMTGLAAALAVGEKPASFARRMAWAPFLGVAAGAVIAATGGRLMIGSLAALAERYPRTHLRVEGLEGAGLAVATTAECALFATSLVGALVLARRLSPR